MALALLLGAVALLALPAVTQRAARRMPPGEWSRACALSLGAGATMFELAVLLYALPLFARVGGFHAFADMCQRMLQPVGTPGVWASVVGAAAAVTVPMLAASGVVAARRSARAAHIEQWLGRHDELGSYELVTLNLDAPIAAAVPGAKPQVVLTEGLVRQLTDEQLRAVVRHEVAHLDERHDRALCAASAFDFAFAFLPFIRSSTGAWRTALERTADEIAAADTDGGRVVLHEALLDVARMLVEPGIAAFSSVDSLLERLDALERPPAARSRLARGPLYAPALLSGVAIALAVASCVGATVALL